MRTARYAKEVLHATCRLLDIDPATELENYPAARITSAINNRAKEAWDDLRADANTVTEERAFRQVWFDWQTYATGTQVYYAGAYYRAIVDTAAGDLPSDATKFALITDPLDKYIELEQFGKQRIAEMLGIWTDNPRINCNARKVPFQPGPYGVDVANWAGPTVWVEFLSQPSEFSAESYDASVTYLADDVVYNTPGAGGDGECYLSLVDNNTGTSLGDSSKWLWQPMPYDIAGYVKYAAASDCTDDVQDKATWRADAQASLGAAFDRQSAAGKHSRYSLTQPRGRRNELAGYCESRNLIGQLPFLDL